MSIEKEERMKRLKKIERAYPIPEDKLTRPAKLHEEFSNALFNECPCA